MPDAIKFDLSTVKGIPDPTTESGEIFLFDEALGQNGQPFVFLVEDPPNKTRPRHRHHADVLYVYVKGEHIIEGEATYRAGDLRWTRAGHVYGPETTGAEGGAWWVISYADPIPVNVEAAEASATAVSPVESSDPQEIPHFTRPYDWSAIDRAVQGAGAAIVEGFLTESETDALNTNIDDYLESHREAALPESGSDVYNIFLGHKTLRLHGLVEKVPASADLIGHPDLVDWASRAIGKQASSVLLNAGELIQIQPGEAAQFPHRDSDSWPVPIGQAPIIVNAIVALDDCTRENGATYVATESWRWDENRQPRPEEYARAVMKRGDAVLFRGDLIHGGGENDSERRRRALSISYCAGWLRPVENSFLNLSRETVRQQPESLAALLGYAAHDGTQNRGGMIGLFENGDPARVLESRTSG